MIPLLNVGIVFVLATALVQQGTVPAEAAQKSKGTVAANKNDKAGEKLQIWGWGATNETATKRGSGKLKAKTGNSK